MFDAKTINKLKTTEQHIHLMPSTPRKNRRTLFKFRRTQRARARIPGTKSIVNAENWWPACVKCAGSQWQIPSVGQRVVICCWFFISGEKLLVGDIVWGKMRNFPWWPGKVLTIANVDNQGPKAQVAWYGYNNYSFLQCDQLCPYLENFKVNTFDYVLFYYNFFTA